MIQDTLSKVVYTADGLQRQWDVPFQFNDSEDLHIYLTDDGVRVEEVFQNFEFNKEGNYVIYPTPESGLAPLEAGKQILILRETPNTQLEDSSQIYFKSNDIERGLDKLTMQVQELARDSYRAVKVSHFDTISPEDFTETLFETGAQAEAAAAAAAASASNASLSEQNAASSKLSAEQASASATASAELAQSAANNSLQYAERAESAAAGSAASASSSAESASLAQDLLNQVGESIYSKPEIDAKVSGLQAEIDLVESYIPSGTNDTNTLVNKQQLLDEEMDIREDLNEGLSELQTQITAQAAAITNKQEKLVAGDNITIDGNVISATGGGGGGGTEVEPATEEKAGIISISTSEEAREGFDDTTAMTPLKTAQVIYDNIGRAIQLGFDGTLSGNVLTFEPDTDTAYELKTGYNYTIDLLFPAVVADGTLDENISMVINNNGESIKIVNALNDDVDTDITVGNMKQIMKYTTDIGFRWIFNARFTTTQDGTKVFVMPSTVVNVQGGGSDIVLPDTVYTSENLVAGDNIEIKEVVNPNILDDDSILCLHFENDVQDSSKYASVSDSSMLTAEYNATAKFGSASAYNVTGSVVSNKFTEISNTLTIDFWANKTLNANGSGAQVNLGYFSFAAYGTESQPQFFLQLAGNTTHWPYTYDSSLLTQEWNHLAGVFEQNQDGYIVARFFVNGKKILEETTSQQSLFSANDDLSSLNFVAGMAIDEFRVSKKAVWTEDFTPPAEPYTVTDDGSKKSINAIIPEGIYTQTNLLGGNNIEIIPEPVEGGIDEYTMACWHFDGKLEDEVKKELFSSETLTFGYGKFGNSVNETSNKTNNVLQDFDTANQENDFTVDFWINPSIAGTGSLCIVGNGNSTSSSSAIRMRIGFFYQKIWLENYYNDESTFYEYPFKSDTWYHFVFQNKQRKASVYLDGKKVLERDFSEKTLSGTGFKIECYSSRMDELRISNVARYNEDFTPPTQPYRLAEPTGNMVINFTGKAGEVGGNGKNIGEVYYSQSSLASDNAGSLPLFTGETIASADTIYPDFYAWVESHTELQTTSEEYETALTTYGECPKYVLSDGSLRLPKLANYIKMANTSEGITQSEAGLPNITGQLDSVFVGDNMEANGAFSATKLMDWTTTSGQGTLDIGSINLNASRSSAIYGASNTVTPAHTTLYPWVCAYNTAIPASTAQAAEFQEGLSGKADTNLGNIPSNYDYVIERYDDGAGNWYEVWRSGKLRQGGMIVGETGEYTINFLKPFANSNYTLVGEQVSSGATNATYQGAYNFFELTETYCKVYNGQNEKPTISWIAEGQGA